jgi:DNA-binding NtrC family response regulator
MGLLSYESRAVLVVEDEHLLRIDSVDFIGDAGFKVYDACDADQAIRLLEEHDDIRFLFTDIEMPGSMDGIKLSHYVRGRWPPMAIIITSGHAVPQTELMPRRSHFIGKPYRAEQILGKMTDLGRQ